MHAWPFQFRSSFLALAAALAAPAIAQAPPAAPPASAPSRAADPRPGELVVTGTRSDVVAGPDRVSFSVANDLQVQNGTLADALRAVPGVEVDLQGQVSLRGDPGVTILIDGRPSAMLRGEGRGDALLSMPAGQVERVEVITNPSAALSPEGSGGVINLVRKQVRKDTRSATIRATAGGEGRVALNLGGAHSSGGLTATADLGYRRFTSDASAVQRRSRREPATGTFIDSVQESGIDTSFESRTARLSVDYDLDKKNRVSTELSYRRASGDVEREDRFTGPSPALSYDRSSGIDLVQRGVDARASWRRTLPGKEHEFLAEIQVQHVRLRRDVEAETRFAAGPAAFERIIYAGNGGEYSLKLDYKRPLGTDGSLNLGYEGERIDREFDFFAARGASPDTLLPVPGLTNLFRYGQIIHAWYGTSRFDLGKLDSQIGLRLEQVERKIDQVTDASLVKDDYFRAYPTVHLGYELSKSGQLRASYSRRIQRPSPQDLNPYTFYVDPQNLRRGNPALLPEVTDSFELALQHRKAGTFYSLTGFYRTSRGGVTDILSVLGGGVFLTSRANLATARRAGAELVASGRLGKALTYNGSATLLHNRIDTRSGGLSAPRSGASATVRANLSWQATPKDFFQLNAVHAGRQLLPQGYRRSGAVLNLGYRRKVNDRLSLLVTGSDVIGSARQVIVFETPTIRDRFRQTGSGRVVLLGLFYNIGGQVGRRRQEPGFDFQQPGAETPQ